MNDKSQNIKKKILVIGSSGHAKVIIDIIEREGKYSIFGLIDSYKDIGITTLGYSIIGRENDLHKIVTENEIYGGIIAIGDNNVRKEMSEKILRIFSDFNFINAIHPLSIIGSEVEIGKGTVIMPGTVVNSGAKINDFCILNTKAVLGRDSIMINYSSLGPGTIIGSRVSIGLCSVVSLGAKVLENVDIGDYTIIGAGSLVVKNAASNKVVFGSPAKVIRNRKEDEFYLSGNKKKNYNIIKGDKTNILITSAGRRVSLVKSFQKEIRDLRINSEVYCTDVMPNLSSACQVADKYFKTSKVTRKNYVSQLIEICNQNQIKIIIPTIDPELIVLARNRELFLEHGIEVIVSDVDFIEKCRDKRLIHQFFDELKFKRAFEYNTNNITYPAFVKPTDGSSSIGTYLLNDKSELTDELLSNPKNMFLEYIDPKFFDEFTVDIYFNKHSEIICVVPRQRILVRSGEVVKGLAIKNEIINFVKSKFKNVKCMVGCITLQVFKHKDNDTIYGIEVNARFGGGYPLTYLTGANYTLWIINEYLLNNSVDEYFEDWEDNLLLLRYDDEILVHDYTN